MSTDISELSAEEILAIAGGEIDPPVAMQASVYPEVDNEPPLPPG